MSFSGHDNILLLSTLVFVLHYCIWIGILHLVTQEEGGCDGGRLWIFQFSMVGTCQNINDVCWRAGNSTSNIYINTTVLLYFRFLRRWQELYLIYFFFTGIWRYSNQPGKSLSTPRLPIFPVICIFDCGGPNELAKWSGSQWYWFNTAKSWSIWTNLKIGHNILHWKCLAWWSIQFLVQFSNIQMDKEYP